MELAYYVIAIFMVFSANFALAVTNPLYCVLSLVVFFLSTGAFLLLLDIEFFALLYILLYVGAISVLFLFVVMMVQFKSDIDYSSRFWALIISQGSVIAIFYFSSMGRELAQMHNFIKYNKTHNLYDMLSKQYSPDLLAAHLYTQYAIIFLFMGVLLLLGVICVIMLTRSIESLPARTKQRYGRQMNPIKRI